MNVFYQVYRIGDETDLKKIELFHGDESTQCRIGCFETLFVINEENQIKKMACNFLLEISNLTIISPFLFYVNLPADLLKKSQSYQYRMFVTKSDDLLKVSRFCNYFENYKREKIDSCENVYETILLPEVKKFRCKEIKEHVQTEVFGMKGAIFHFCTSVPNILKNINYNILNNCNIEQFHGGDGDNNK